MMRLVLDASALVDFVARGRAGATVAVHLRQAQELLAPDLLYTESLSALWRLARAGALTDDDAAAAVERVLQLPVTVLPARHLAQRAWGHRESVRLSDAFYLACAQLAGAPLLTCDARLGRGHHGVPVLVA